MPKPISVDCAALFLGTRDPPKALSGYSRLSFFWREISRNLVGGPWVALSKVKAHRTLDSAVDDADRANIAGSISADTWAKVAARCQNLNPQELSDFERGECEYSSLVVGVTSILALFPDY